MANYKLQIRDGDGEARELYTDSGSNGIVPYHAISGAIAIQASDLATLTSSISAVSSAVARSLDKFIGSLLDNGSSSFNVDIVAGDVNALTQSINTVTAEVARLTALSGAGGEGLLVRGGITASVSNWPTINAPAYVVHSGSLNTTSSIKYATFTAADSYEYTSLTSSAQAISGEYLSLTIQNNTNHYLYIRLGQNTCTPSEYDLRVDAGATYEAQPVNTKLEHAFILDPAVSNGVVKVLPTGTTN